MKKIRFLFVATFAITNLFAQTKETYGLFKKSDGTKIKGTSTRRSFEDQVIIAGYTGGSDNSAVIEIEVPMGTYITEFRNLMNTGNASAKVIAAKPKTITAPTAIKQDIGVKISPALQPFQSQQPVITRAEITVVNNNPGQSPQYQWVNTIVLEDVKVESCTDDAASGKSKVKLKGSRIGWIYYAYDKQGARSSTKSGWNAAIGQAWNNF